jgi:cystathionine gamma-synthase
MAVTTGRDPAPGAPLNVPPTFAATYRDGGSIGYGRWGNPTWSAFEEAIGTLEGGRAVAFSCGQAAVAALVDGLQLGARVLFPMDAYLGTRALLRQLAARGAVTLAPVDVTDTGAVLSALEGVDLLWLESPTNPNLGIADLPALLGAAERAGVPSVVDNTFATPMVQRPLEWGASAVVHSATKYIGGHSDLLLGVVVTRDDQRRDDLVAQRTLHGAVPGVMEAYLALRGLRTLPLRMARQQETAGDLATRLGGHPSVRRVRYPGLAQDPHHERARGQMDGFGAIVSFELATAEAADRLIGNLALIVGSTSLGGVETTIDRRSRWPGEDDVAPGLLRLSVGLEHAHDLWADLAHGLELSSGT